jgi:hypothetical protein
MKKPIGATSNSSSAEKRRPEVKSCMRGIIAIAA